MTLADRYELGEVLGRGGMADVHRGHDRLLDRPVAVKLLRESTGDESERSRFTLEARTLAGLSHPGLVMLLDAGITGDQPYLVMELVEGPTLARLLEHGGLPLDRAVGIAAQVADALAYAHARGVVHRDIKPANVLIGTHQRVKLADFGIVRVIGNTLQHTRTGTTIGTAAYLSPEQVEGGDVSGASDVYALGLVLLESLTGERAFPGTPAEATLGRLHRDPPVPPALPRQLRDLLVAMTHRDPAQRPTAGEVSERLRGRAADPAPTRVMADSRTPRADRFGDALAHKVTTWWGQVQQLPERQDRAALGVVLALILLVIVVAGLAAP